MQIHPLNKSQPMESIAKERVAGKNEVQSAPQADQINLRTVARGARVSELVKMSALLAPSRTEKVEAAKNLLASGAHNDRQTIAKTAHNMLYQHPLDMEVAEN
jgi:hypothetical protein